MVKDKGILGTGLKLNQLALITGLIIAVLFAWPSISGMLAGFGLAPQALVGAQAIITTPAQTVGGTDLPAAPSLEFCDSQTKPEVEITAKEGYAPFTFLNSGLLDVNVFKANGEIVSTYNGTGSSYGATFAQKEQIDAILIGEDNDSGTDYYHVKIEGFNVDCLALIPFNQSVVREGTLAVVVVNSDGLNQNTPTALADPDSGQTYTWTLRVQEPTAQAAFGSPSSSKKVNLRVDYNSTFWLKMEVLYNGANAAAGIVTPINDRNETLNSSVAFTVPQLGLANSAIDAKTQLRGLVRTGAAYSYDQNFGLTATYHALTRECTAYTCSRIQLWFEDYTIFYNENSGNIEENTYDPASGTDLGASDVWHPVWYK